MKVHGMSQALLPSPRLTELASDLHTLRAALVAAAARHADDIARCPLHARPSATNLVHYLELRSHDLRALQERLARAGLSSLGRCEAHVLTSVDAVLSVLACAVGSEPPPEDPACPLDFDEGERRLEASARALLGPRPKKRRVRIMVTLASEAADDARLVRALLSHGTDLVRINCAHDDPPAWERMIHYVRESAAALDRPCVVTMDLEGPKVRTRELAEPIALSKGDQLRLVRAPSGLGANVVVSIPGVLDDVKPGDSVWFDDGKIGGVVECVDAGGATIRITHARGGTAELATDKGINFPDSTLHVDGFTGKDRTDLSFVAKYADVVSISFAQHRADVRAIGESLNGAAESMGVILKIETRAGFEALPRLLLDALGKRPLGVMIARGDLALEIGYERLAEVQEEILWICEAAHVPVIWATQVLERMAKDGVPTRAEVTDAAMAERAECVMLNKGKHVVDAVRFLDDILCRMEGHQHKKRSTFRPLAVSRLP
jgi:pyruvate kinase